MTKTRLPVTDEGEYGVGKMKPQCGFSSLSSQCNTMYTSVLTQVDAGEWMTKVNITSRTRQAPISYWQEKKLSRTKLKVNVFDLHKRVGLIYHKRKNQSRERSCYNSWCFISGLHSFPSILLDFKQSST